MKNWKAWIILKRMEFDNQVALVTGGSRGIGKSVSMELASGGAYVLGLLDCIGELKRLALDSIRAGNAGEAQRVFWVMQELYEAVYPFATLDKVVKDVRRKLDVNRSLIEGVRAAVTEEARRAELIRALRERRADAS